MQNDVIKLKKSYVNECETFKKLIKEGSEYVIPNENGGFTINGFDYYFITTWSFLCEITNMEKVLTDECSSSDGWYYPFIKLFDKFRDYEKKDLLEKFLKELNKELSEIENIESKMFNFAFYTNIKVSEKNIDNWENLFEDFDIYRLKYNDIKIDHMTHQKKTSFRTSNEILGVKIHDKYINNAFCIAKKRLYFLFGVLTFFDKYNKNTEKWHVNEFALNYELSSIKITSYLLLDEKNGLCEKYNTAFARMNSKIRVNSKQLSLSPDKLDELNKITKIKDSDKNKLKLKLNGMFESYYYASIESSLDSSFLKFWILSERTLKEMLGDMKGEKLLKIMNNLLKKKHKVSKNNRILLNSLYKKRNSLVHEYKSNNITEFDRNFAKKVAEYLLIFFISHFKDFRNMDEYGFLLENMNKDSNEIIRNIEILEYIVNLNNE